jgi:hypothetical protein
MLVAIALVVLAATAPSTVHVADTRSVGEVRWQIDGATRRIDVHTLTLETGIPSRRLLRVDVYVAPRDVHTLLLDADQARAVRQAMARITDHPVATRVADVEGVRLQAGPRAEMLQLQMPGQPRPVAMPRASARRVIGLLDRGLTMLGAGDRD